MGGRAAWVGLCLFGFAGFGAWAADVSAAKAGTHLWTFVAPNNKNCNIVIPLIDKDRAYMAMTSRTIEDKLFIYGINRDSGAVLWSTDVGGMSVSSAAVHQGRVFVRGTNLHASESHLTCLDGATGKVLWKQRLEFWNDAEMETEAPIFAQDMALLRGSAVAYRGLSQFSMLDEDHLYAFEVGEGYPVWDMKKLKSELAGFGPLSQELNGRVYFARKHYIRKSVAAWTWSCMLSSFSPSTGVINEEFVAESGIARVVLDPDPKARRVYIQHASDNLAAYDLDTGKILWQKPDVKMQRAFVADHGVVVFAEHGGFVRCIDGKTGRERWRKYVDKNLEAPLIHKDQVLLSAWKFTTSLSLKDGTPQWELYTRKAAFAGKPAADGDLVLVPAAYTTEGRSLYAIKLGRPKE